MKARWVVANRPPVEPRAGNGIWSEHQTRIGALLTLRRILAGTYSIGKYDPPLRNHYTLPAGGVEVRRARPAVEPPKEAQ